MSLECCACEIVKPLEDFSNAQLRKKDAPRCRLCVNCNMPTVIPSPCSDKGDWRRCRNCKLRQSTDRFDDKEDGKNEYCKACVRERQWKREERTNKMQRRSSYAGACRVQDVQSVYGHSFQIPLAAYQEAGVASSPTDYVTEKDVQRASDALFARGMYNYAAHQNYYAFQWGMAQADMMAQQHPYYSYEGECVYYNTA